MDHFVFNRCFFGCNVGRSCKSFKVAHQTANRPSSAEVLEASPEATIVPETEPPPLETMQHKFVPTLLPFYTTDTSDNDRRCPDAAVNVETASLRRLLGGNDPRTGNAIRGSSSRGGQKLREKRELYCTYACYFPLGPTYL